MSDFFNKYPYTDFHELNLDWVIERVKQLTEDWIQTAEAWEGVQQDWADTEQAWIDFKAYVENYLANLDVQDEIDSKINRMIADGSFDTLLRPIVYDQITAIDVPNIVTDWLNDNVTPVGGAVVVDSSLTVEGAAADAKSTGEGIGFNADSLEYLIGDNLFTTSTKTTGQAYRPNTHAIQVIAGYGTAKMPVIAGHTYQLSGYSSSVPPFGYTINNSADSRVTDDLITGNMKITIPTNGASILITYKIADDSTVYFADLDDVQNTLDSYKANEQYINNSKISRITLKDFSETIQPGGFDYVGFSGGVPYNDKLVYAVRGSYEHLARNTILGKIFIYESSDGETFSYSALDIDNSEIGGELRDCNLSLDRSGSHLLLTAFTNDGYPSSHIYSYMFVLDSSYDILYRIQIGTDGDMATGNTLETPDGYLLKACYTASNDIKIYRSNVPISSGFSSMSFSLVDTLSSGTTITEPTMFYADDKLYILTRGDSTSSVIFNTSDLEGETGWSAAVSLDVTLHCPTALPYYKGNIVDIAAGYWLSLTVRIPVMVYIDVTAGQVKYIMSIDDSLTGAGGYAGVVKLGDNDYRVMYYDDNGSNTATALYYKKFNPYTAKNGLYYIN